MINLFNFFRVFVASESLPVTGMLVLFVLIIFITAYFLYVYRKEREFERAQEGLQNDYDSIMLHAHKKAQEIITQSSDKAKDLLLQTKDVKNYAEKDIDDSIKKETEEILQSFSASLDGIKHDALDHVKHMADETQVITQQQLASFRDSMQKDLITVRSQETEKLTEEAKKAYIEIQTYKAKQMEKIKEQISQIAIRVTENVIGRSIPITDQEKLVLESLEEAKQEGFFEP